MEDSMFIKKIKSPNQPFSPFHLILEMHCPADRQDLNDILHDYVTRYPNQTTDRIILAKRILKLLGPDE
jgi:hypothetical protein